MRYTERRLRGPSQTSGFSTQNYLPYSGRRCCRRAFNARTGEVVWTFRTGSNFRSSPISYLRPDGRQYVAIISSQLGANTRVAADAAPDADIRFRRSGATLYVSALPRSAVSART
jgi:hypothetical protein